MDRFNMPTANAAPSLADYAARSTQGLRGSPYEGAVSSPATGLNALRNRIDELNGSFNAALEALELTADRVLGSLPTACGDEKRPMAPGVLGDTDAALDRTETLLKRLHSAVARVSIL